METKIREFIEDCFADAPRTQKVSDLKEELFANMCDRYRDLVASGMTEEKAFRRVIDSMGNIDEIIRNLSETAPEYLRRLNERRRKTALVLCGSVAICVFAVILSTIMVVVAHMNPVLSSMLSLGLIMVGVIWVAYYFLSRPKLLPPNMDVSQLAGFAVPRRVPGDPDYKRSGSIMAIYAPLMVIVFFIIGFGFGGWWWGWLVFLTIPVMAGIAKLIDRR